MAAKSRSIIPEFLIGRSLRTPVTSTGLNKLMTIDGITAAGYVQRRDRTGRAIKSYTNGANRMWRPIDVIAAAKADCLSIEPASVLQVRALAATVDKWMKEAAMDISLMEAGVALTNKRMLSEEEIVSAAGGWSSFTGVYFLIENDKVVYVGQSLNIFSRVMQHVQNKKFARVAYIPCSQDQLDAIESLYIHALKPKLNGRVHNNPDAMRAPLSLPQIMARLSTAP